MNLVPLLFFAWGFIIPSEGNNIKQQIWDSFMEDFLSSKSFEYEEIFGDFKRPKRQMMTQDCDVIDDDDVDTHDAPDSLDWRTDGLVTEVKNEGKCEAGWAFATIGNIEGQYVKKYGEKKDFSSQQLIDCLQDCDGCGSCSSNTAMSSLVDLGGVQLEADYPYKGVIRRCHYKPALSKVKIAGCTNYDLTDEDKLKEVLAKTGPLFVAINSELLKRYTKGIITNCPEGTVDTAVLLVGYGTEDNVDYWLIKNSWGLAWGEQGYAKIQRGVNACGIMNENIASVTIK